MAEPASIIISNWNHLIEGFETSPKQYYALVEEAIKRRNLPDIKISRIDWKEGGIMSAKREYLRVRRRDYIFDICGAPFGNGFFFSWWLGEKAQGCLVSILEFPVIGTVFGFLLKYFLKPATYYRIDSAIMFQKSVHAAILEVIDTLTTEKGIKALTEMERKPTMTDFFKQ